MVVIAVADSQSQNSTIEILGEKKVVSFPFFHPMSRRFHLTLILMFGYFCTNYMRTNLGMTMTCMVNSTAISILQNISHPMEISSTSTRCTYSGKSNDSSFVNDYGGTLDWTTETQDWLFTATFWGSLVSTLPGGYLIVLTSPILLLGLSTIIIIFSTAIFPLLVFQTSYSFVFASRFLLGVGVGPILPAMDSLIVRWVPNAEKGLAVSIYTTGVQLSGALGIPFTAALCASGWKWPAVYYITAIAAVVWLIIFCSTVRNSPSKTRCITKRELIYLEETIGQTAKRSHGHIPWLKILTCIPLFACYVCQFTNSMSLTLLQAYQPTFFKEILFLPVFENGVYCAITNIVLCVFKIVWGILMHKIALKYSTNLTTKLSQGFACIASGIALIALGYTSSCDQPLLSLFMFSLFAAGIGAASNGFYTSMVSIAPPFVGILSSISKMFALFGMLATPYIVTIFRKNESIEEWRIIFFIMAGISLCSGFIFLLFGKCEIAKWAKIDKKDGKTKKEVTRQFSDVSVVA